MGDVSESRNFDLNDFRKQVERLKHLGSLREVLRKIPELGPLLHQASHLDLDLEAEVGRIEGIIDSMTPAERSDPRRIDGSRRRRIAAGAGAYPTEVVSLLKQFEDMAAMVRSLPSARLDSNGSHAAAEADELADHETEPQSARSGAEPSRSRSGRRVSQSWSPVPTEVRRLHVEEPMSPLDRATLRRLWEVLARNGRTPAGEEPWFTNWNRNLRLWDFDAED